MARPLRIGILASNLLRIHENVRKGTEIFVYMLATALYEEVKDNPKYNITCFASHDSDLHFPIQSIREKASIEDPDLLQTSHKLLELSLFSKAFEKEKEFDLFHIHVSNGEWLLPFSRMTNIPLLITLHGGVNSVYDPNIFAPYNDIKHIHFVSISDAQRNRLPALPYVKTVYHGVNLHSRFTFSEAGGEYIMWAGRAIPEKGLDKIVGLFELFRKPTHLFPIVIDSQLPYLTETLIDRIDILEKLGTIEYTLNLTRKELAPKYQKSKVFIFPLQWEEPFGFVMVEAMACGTPLIAFARGSTMEIIKDGETGFLVNPSDQDIRGNFITKKTGFEGLCEATERLYGLSHEAYRNMRQACRNDAEKRFTTQRMANDYLSLYEELARRD